MALIVTLLVGLAAPALALDTPNERITLVGLTGVHLVVYDEMHGEGERAGLGPSSLQAELEQRLRTAGLRALSASEALRSLSRPTLELRLKLMRSREVPQLYVYAVGLALRQQIQLARDRTIDSFAITWSEPPEVGTVEQARLSVVRDAIRAKVEQFITAWQAANPD
ncbi:MAG TPA: hypothetical protein VGT40_20205 [Methylomirabilota bacterium]|nr:hypothetical protein [Methylomirabilota bacterium]